MFDCSGEIKYLVYFSNLGLAVLNADGVISHNKYGITNHAGYSDAIPEFPELPEFVRLPFNETCYGGMRLPEVRGNIYLHNAIDWKKIIVINLFLYYVSNSTKLLLKINNKVLILFDPLDGTLEINSSASAYKQSLIDDIRFTYDSWGRVVGIQNLSIIYNYWQSTVSINGIPIVLDARRREIVRIGDVYEKTFNPSFVGCTIL